MQEIVIETARISFVEGILIIIGILWLLGFLRSRVYVPMVIQQEKKSESDKEVVVSDQDKTIYRQKKHTDETYTDFEEIKS